MAEVINDALACPVCYEHRGDPKILTCGHTICKKCLDGIYRSESHCQVTCPICRNATSVPMGDVSKLPTNITMKGLIDDLTSAPPSATSSATSSATTDLQNRAEMKVKTVLEHAEYANHKKQDVKEAISACRGEIEKAYDEAAARLFQKKNSLLRVCDEKEAALVEKLDKIVEKDDGLVSSISTALELMNKGVKSFDKDPSKRSGDAVCVRLRELLTSGDPNLSDVTTISSCGEMLHFKMKETNLDLGDIVIATGEWKVQAVVKFSENDSINGFVLTAGGKVAAGSRFGGIEIFSPHGQLKQRGLKEVNIREIAFLSDDRCVVRNCNEQVSLYTPEWKKLNVIFHILTKDVGGVGGITVDSGDYIYVSYRKAKIIQIFTPAGGNAVKEILCRGYEPMQLFVMEPSKMLVVKTDRGAIRVLNHQGKERHNIVKDCYIHPAVGNKGTIFIALLNAKRDRVSIDRYSSELKHVSTLIKEHTIEKTTRNWYALQEFPSGELALCTTDRLYIFHKTGVTTEVHV